METTGKLLRNLVILGVTLLLLGAWSLPAALAQVQDPPLNPNNIPQFVESLPLLDIQGGPIETVVNPAPTALQNIYMHEFTAMMLPAATKLKKSNLPVGTGPDLRAQKCGVPERFCSPGPQATCTGPVFDHATKRPRSNSLTPCRLHCSQPDTIYQGYH
jgi:hypothetical protein